MGETSEGGVRETEGGRKREPGVGRKESAAWKSLHLRLRSGTWGELLVNSATQPVLLIRLHHINGPARRPLPLLLGFRV